MGSFLVGQLLRKATVFVEQGVRISAHPLVRVLDLQNPRQNAGHHVAVPAQGVRNEVEQPAEQLLRSGNGKARQRMSFVFFF